MVGPIESGGGRGWAIFSLWGEYPPFPRLWDADSILTCLIVEPCSSANPQLLQATAFMGVRAFAGPNNIYHLVLRR